MAYTRLYSSLTSTLNHVQRPACIPTTTGMTMINAPVGGYNYNNKIPGMTDSGTRINHPNGLLKRRMTTTIIPVTFPVFATTSSTSMNSNTFGIAIRGFATNRKVIDAKNAKRLKIQAKKKKNVGHKQQGAASDGTIDTKDDDTAYLQHQEWVKFQQSISVDGFQTGQTVVTQTVMKKSRGGKQARARRERELANLQSSSSDDFLGGAAAASTTTSSSAVKFPAIRYSEQETKQLLELAFASLPPKTGKRGTRNLKRQDNRWNLVRKIRSKYKHSIRLAHERRMLKRQEKRNRTKSVKEMASQIRQEDLEYQAKVLKQWAQTMILTNKNTTTTSTNEIMNGGSNDLTATKD